MRATELLENFARTVAESFDTTADWTYAQGPDGSAIYAAKVDDAYIEITYKPTVNTENGVIISFTRDGDAGVTGKGSENKVFGAVINHIKNWVNIREPEVVIFTARKPADETGATNASRSQLYKRMVKRFASQAGYDYDVDSASKEDTFYLEKQNDSNVEENFADGKKKAKSLLVYETVDVDAIHAAALKQHLLANPSLLESTNEFSNAKKFLENHRTETPEIGKKYIYVSIQTVPISKFINIARFQKPYKLVDLDNTHAYFEIDNKIKKYPESGTLSGDALTEIYFFLSTTALEKFAVLLDLQFSDYKKSIKQLDENFADGKKKGKSRPGRVKRAGASCDGSVTSLRKKAKNASGEKQKMYHWCANMKSGKK